jgi:hypothetical protein
LTMQLINRLTMCTPATSRLFRRLEVVHGKPSGPSTVSKTWKLTCWKQLLCKIVTVYVSSSKQNSQLQSKELPCVCLGPPPRALTLALRKASSPRIANHCSTSGVIETKPGSDTVETLHQRYVYHFISKDSCNIC